MSWVRLRRLVQIFWICLTDLSWLVVSWVLLEIWNARDSQKPYIRTVSRQFRNLHCLKFGEDFHSVVRRCWLLYLWNNWDYSSCVFRCWPHHCFCCYTVQNDCKCRCCLKGVSWVKSVIFMPSEHNSFWCRFLLFFIPVI